LGARTDLVGVDQTRRFGVSHSIRMVTIVTYKYHIDHRTIIMASTTTTISLRKETKELLRRFGSKGQTYDEVIRELIEKASTKEHDARWNRILEEEEFIPLDEL